MLKVDRWKSRHKSGVGGIYAVLSEVSRRPRYAFLVLQLVAEIAEEGRAGPYMRTGAKPMLLREWLCTQLLPMSEQTVRAGCLAGTSDRVVAELTGNSEADRQRSTTQSNSRSSPLAANISRAISDSCALAW